MQNNLKSKYTIDLKIQDDTKDAIRNLESEMSKVGKAAKESSKSGDLAKGLNDAEKAADEMIHKLDELSKNTEIDFNAIIKSYSKSSSKTIGELEKQYAQIKNVQAEIAKQEKELNDLRAAKADTSTLIDAEIKLHKIYEENNIYLCR